MSLTPVDFPRAALLVVVPNVGIAVADDRVFMDVKAAAGLSLYARFWPGPVRCVSREVDARKIGFGRWFERYELPFECVVLSPEASAATVAAHASDATVVLAGADNHLDLGLVAALPTVPVVMTIEYTLRTRLDILRLEDSGLLRKIKSALWLINTERYRKRELRNAAGIQANGAPAFTAYCNDDDRAHRYFDTRLRAQDFIGLEGANAKATTLMQRAPLRLAFSGRLDRMKGVDDLISVAAALARRGKSRARLEIFGDGQRRRAMQATIDRAGLGDFVRLNQPLKFDEELVPLMKSSVDLFVCCHRQGDPSCTYLETLGCGVPIVGYLNEAFEGVLTLGKCGLGVEIGDVDAMVSAIEQLDEDRVLLGEFTRSAARIAESRLFETVFAERINHLRTISSCDERFGSNSLSEYATQ
ncbi:MAG: hypothetical protein JWR80_3176 [Bradyrhizobium sp.]|nr:hypothetical protein [Bradyrhizobium sp.]